jgi:hypothetical protein
MALYPQAFLSISLFSCEKRRAFYLLGSDYEILEIVAVNRRLVYTCRKGDAI